MGARFSAPVQTGCEVHPASYTMGTGSSQGVKQPRRGVDHTSNLAPRLKKQNYTSTPPLGLRGLLYGELYFTLLYFTLQYSFGFCSDVSFRGIIFSRKLHILFVLTLLISDLTFVFLLLSLLVSVHPDISKIFFRIMSENNCSHKYVLPNIKNIWGTKSITFGHETSVC